MPADPYLSSSVGPIDLVPREDPVVYGTASGPLSTAQLAEFERDGFVVLPDWLPAAHMAELFEEARRITRESPQSLIREPDRISIRSIREPHRRSPVFAALARDPRIVDLARQIVGEVYLYRSRLDFKAPLHGREFYWQSDFEVWHEEDGLARMRAVTACVMLAGLTAGGAPLLVVPGSHRMFVRSESGTPTHDDLGPSRAAVAWLVEDGGISVLTGTPGTVVLLDSNTLHASTCNLAPRPATTLSLSYNSIENAPSLTN